MPLQLAVTGAITFQQATLAGTLSAAGLSNNIVHGRSQSGSPRGAVKVPRGCGAAS
jgi:hypothetical protein